MNLTLATLRSFPRAAGLFGTVELLELVVFEVGGHRFGIPLADTQALLRAAAIASGSIALRRSQSYLGAPK